MNSELLIGTGGNIKWTLSSGGVGFLFIKWTLPSGSKDICILTTFTGKLKNLMSWLNG
jgi:hypothetical protein